MDEAAHLWIPAACLVAEMHAGLQQLRNSYLSHGLLPLYAIGCRAEDADPVDDEKSMAGQGRDLRPHGSKIF